MPLNCQKCQAFITDDLPGGLCPRCLMEVAQKSQRDSISIGQSDQRFKVPSISDLTRLFPELEILELVGQGGMGAVFKARQRDLDRLVALKVFLYRPNDPEFAERFKREARALGRLSHPNIVTVHNFGIREAVHFLVMEFVDGLNLRQITTAEKLEPLHAMQLVPQLCDALQYAHNESVIHRDIKPENILLDSRGNIKIADFGLAKIAGSTADAGLTQTQQVMGTWNYMAPEQKERPTEVDHRADIYSLGVVIYEMLTGELPLGRFQAPSKKANIDARLDEIVMRALEKEPGRRYQQASEFKSGFASVGSARADMVGQAAGFEGQTEGFVPGANAGNAVPMTAVPPVKEARYQNAEAGMRLHVCVMAGREKRGNWKVGDPNLMLTLMGGSCLDLSNVTARHVNIVSFVMMGGVEIIVPPGAQVDVDGLVIMGGTFDRVRHDGAQSPMTVRVRSFGLMGGCEVRTAKIPKSQRPVAPTKQKPASLWQRAILLLWQTIATLVVMAVPILFVLSSFDFVGDQEDLHLAGVVTAIVAGMFWAMVGPIRRLVNLPPPDISDDELGEFQSRTKSGSLVRMLGFVCLFACPILLVIQEYESGDEEMKFAGIVCAIVGGGLFIGAGKLDEFLRKQ
jgi:tRNA A-37 threonylcarbamoyl transferase component Bud32